MQCASRGTHGDDEKTKRKRNQRQRIANKVSNHRAQDAGSAAANPFDAQTRSPLANRSSGDARHHAEIADGDYQSQNDSDFLSSAASEARAAAHQARNHDAEG